MKLRLAITGSGGYLAQTLITRLSSNLDCEFILGLDIRPRSLELPIPSLFLRYDMTMPWGELRDYFRSRGINAALHLAWQFNPIHDAKRHRQVDVEGSQNFFRAAEAAGLRRVIYTSSTTSYLNPANPSEPPYISEETPVTGTPRYLYSKHKAEVDQIAQSFMARHPEIQVVILRPSIVLGPNTQNIVSKMISWPWRSFPWVFQVRDADPPMQFTSEDDIGELLYRAVVSDARGIFNVAGDGVVRFNEVVRAIGKRPLAIPAALLYPTTGLLWRLRLAPFPAGILDMIRYPWVADNSRLKTAFAYIPRLTSKEALEEFAAAQGFPGERPRSPRRPPAGGP
jgi:UDP-glucose 4-epimerase